MSQELKANDSTRIEHVGRSGIYPPSGPYPPGDFQIRGQGALAHPEERVDRTAVPVCSVGASRTCARSGEPTTHAKSVPT